MMDVHYARPLLMYHPECPLVAWAGQLPQALFSLWKGEKESSERLVLMAAWRDDFALGPVSD